MSQTRLELFALSVLSSGCRVLLCPYCAALLLNREPCSALYTDTHTLTRLQPGQFDTPGFSHLKIRHIWLIGDSTIGRAAFALNWQVTGAEVFNKKEPSDGSVCILLLF